MLDELCNLAADRIDDLLDRLDIDVRRYNNKYVGACPVHGGDQPTAFHLHPDGDYVRGAWGCYTKKCHRHFVRSLLGLTRGVLSHRRLEWKEPGNRVVPHSVAVDYLLDFVGMKIGDVHYDAAAVSNTRFMQEVEYLRANPPRGRGICTREEFRRRVEMPCGYFLDRGYSRSILDVYDVGMCVNPNSNLFGRAIVPVYDDAGEMVVGCIGRSVHPRCPGCGLYHDPDPPCIPGGDRTRDFKWVCSSGFTDKYFLYNYWRAKFHVEVSRCLVLVEGPGDVWRLEEGGVHNAVAMMGSELTDVQRGLVEFMPLSSIVVATDMDPGGESGAKVILDRCKHLANVTRFTLPTGRKDIGEMTRGEVAEHVLPFVRSRSRRM